MLKLTKTAHSVMQNITAYWEGVHDTPDLIKDATKAKQWKCYKHNDGNWRFGPSRFVGYEGMTPKKYVEHKKTSEGGLNGTQTEDHFKLHKWATTVPEKSELHFKLADLVSKFLSKSGKKLNVSAQFAILGGLDEEDLYIPDKDGKRVDALVTLAAPLPDIYRKTLIRKLTSLEKGCADSTR